METLGFLKIKIEETKGVWDNFFFTYENLGLKKIKIEEKKGVWNKKFYIRNFGVFLIKTI